MTFDQAVADWRKYALPQLPANDLPARRQSWVEYVDALHRDGHITDRQADRWDQPRENKGGSKVRFERETSFGAHVEVVAVELEDGRLQVIEYWTRKAGRDRRRRDPREEGRIYRREQLDPE